MTLQGRFGFAVERGVWIFACYIASIDNLSAEFVARSGIERDLFDEAFQLIQTYFNTPSIDLFAAKINLNCDNNVSYHQKQLMHLV